MRNYDGSWTEWGNSVRVPIEVGRADRGQALGARPAVSDTDRALPPALAEIAEDFHAMSTSDRLQLLLEFSDGLPDLPERYAGHAELMEQVEECQSPLFLAVEVEGGRRRPRRSGSSSTRRRRRRRRAASPASCTPAWTA